MRSLAFSATVLLGACNIPGGATGNAAVASAPEPALIGRFRLVEVDGRPAARGLRADAPYLLFDSASAGGNVGCNSFGGQGLAHEGRWYGGPVVSTQMGCNDPIGAQETIVQGLLASGPRIVWRGEGRVELVGRDHRIALVPGSGAPSGERAASVSLLGGFYRFSMVDGAYMPTPDAKSRPGLRTEGERFVLTTPCLTSEGRWRPTGAARATFTPDAERATPCAAAAQGPSKAVVAALRGEMRFVGGANGELVLAGGGHWLVGEAVRRGTADMAAINGLWRVRGGGPVRPGARPPEVRFAGRAFYLWDGCNHSEGLAILFERTLHTHGSGLSTLANCAPGQSDARLKTVVHSAPQVGLLPGGGLLLRSAPRELRLERAGPATTDRSVSSRLAPGMRFALMDLGDGGRLELLPGSRFRLTQPCGVTEGRWRAAPGEVEGGVRFGPDRPADGCMADPRARDLQHDFLGNLDVAIGPNRDIALFAGRFGVIRARLER